MKIIKTFLSILISIILIFSSIVFQASITLKHNLFNDKFYMQKINKSNIYDKLEKSIFSTFSDYASKNKLPSSATEDMISPLWVQTQFKTVIEGMISYTSRKTDVLPVIDEKTPTDKFNNDLAQVLTKKNIVIDRITLEKAKTEFFKSFSEIPFTESWNEIHGNDVKSNLYTFRKYSPVLNYLPYISLVIMIACILLFFLTTTNLSSWKLWTGYTLIVSGLITSLSSFVISTSSFVNNFLTDKLIIPKDSVLPPKATISLLKDIINTMIMGVTKYGGVIAFAGIGVIIIVSLFDTKKNNVFWYKHKPLK